VEDERLYRAITSLTLGIPLAFAVSAAAERHRLPAVFAWVVTAVLLGAHYASAEWQTTTAFFYRSAELVFAAHLLVAFLPYVGGGRADGFWAYNESLFTRAVTAVVFSAVLFVGLAVGLLTVRYLLGVEVEPQAFGYLFIAVVFGFNTWFFLPASPIRCPTPRPTTCRTRSPSSRSASSCRSSSCTWRSSTPTSRRSRSRARGRREPSATS
jgi:hypothetical protein